MFLAMGFDACYKMLVSQLCFFLAAVLAAEQMLMQKWLSCYMVQLFTTPNSLKVFPRTDYIIFQS